mgnify:FL=1
MTLARCGRCQALTTLEYSARVEYEDPGMPNGAGVRKRSRCAMRLCPACSKRASKHMSRFFRMTITRERVEA